MRYAEVTTSIYLKRIYDKPSPKDGFRILVDRLWHRGIKKEDAKIDLWCKDIAPSNDLRKWFGHNQAKWDEFRRRYFEELVNQQAEVSRLFDKIGKMPLTLLFSAKDKIYNNAAALLEYIKKLKTNEIFTIK
jgi:uncharacterized protein YeaO (DUF488 family)